MKRAYAAVAALALALGLAACGGYPEEGDTPAPGYVDDSSVETPTPEPTASFEPLSEAGMYTFCNHGNRVYVGQARNAIAVVPADPTCKETP